MKPAIIKGWDIPKPEYLKAHQEGNLIKLLIDLSNVCNLSCVGCFTKRVDGEWNNKSKKRLPNEISYETQIGLLEEAAELGVRTVDIVGAGEPTLDPNFPEIIDKINDLGMHAVVFTHGVSKALNQTKDLADRNISFFVKLWSRNPELQGGYVSGSISNYSRKRDEALERLIETGLSKGKEVSVDGINYKTTRLGADILVMKSNYEEIPELLKFCRQNNIMPIIKTFIPEGPTRFDQAQNIKVYSAEHLAQLRRDEVTPEEFNALRKRLASLDETEFDIPEMKTFYPQSVKCTQSMASLYVTITGEIKSCVGTHFSYGHYEAGKGMLKKALQERIEKVGFGCVPRVQDARERNLPIEEDLLEIYTEGMR